MKPCTANVNDILPVIDQNRDYVPDDVIDCQNIYEELGISHDKPAADFFIHYKTCKHIIVEEGKKNKTVEKVRKQIGNTVAYVKNKGGKVDFIAFVYEELEHQDSKTYTCRGNFLHYSIYTKFERVMIEGLPLRCFRKSEIQKMRKNKDIQGF